MKDQRGHAYVWQHRHFDTERPRHFTAKSIRPGETVQTNVGSATIEEDGVRAVVLEANADVNQLAAALNELGLTARDVIGIFQAIDRAGALQGELIIL